MTKAPSETPRRPRRWLRRLLWTAGILIVLAALLAAFAPTILSMSMFRGTILYSVNARIPVEVNAQSLSFSWFGSQEVQGLSIRTKDGKKVADLKKVALEQGLYDLVRNSDRIGVVMVEDGEVWTDGVKAVAQAAAQPAAPSTPTQGPPTMPAGVTIKNIVVHSTGPALLTVTSAELSGTGDNPRKIDLSWQLGIGGAAGKGTVQGTVDGLGSDWRGWDAIGLAATVNLYEVPTEAAWSLASDFDVSGGLSGSGTLTGNLQAARTRDGAISATMTNCAGKNILVTGDLLQGDRPALSTLNLSGKVAYDKGVIDVTGLDLACPVATVKANGRFALAALKGASPEAGGKVSIAAELAPLFTMLPNTLKAQKDLTVRSGTVEGTLELGLAGVPGSKNTVATLTINVSARDLKADRNGKTLALAPVKLNAEIAKTFEQFNDVDPNHPAASTDTWETLKSLDVRSLELAGPFGSVVGHGRLESLILDTNLDLTNATREVGQFIDLGEYGAQGRAVLHLESKGNFESGLSLVASGNLENIKLAMGQGRTWQEDKASIDVAGDVVFLPNRGAGQLAPKTEEIKIQRLIYAGTSASLEASGSIRTPDNGWVYVGKARGRGDLNWLTTIVETIVTGKAAETIAPAPVAAANEATGAVEWRQAFRQFISGLRDPETHTVPGRWSFEAEGTYLGTEGFEAVLSLRLGDVVLAPPIQVASPLHVKSAILECKADHEARNPWKVNFKNIEVTAKEVSLKAKGYMDVSEDWRFGTLTGNISADVQGDLAWVSGSLLKMGFWPKDYKAAGAASVSVKADLSENGQKTGEFSVTGDNLKVAIGTDHTLNEAHVAASGKFALTFDDKTGDISNVKLPEYHLALAAGTLTGDAKIARGEDGFHYEIAAVSKDGGDVASLARTAAGLTGLNISGSGKWNNLHAGIEVGPKELVASGQFEASDLVIGPLGKLKKPLHVDVLKLAGSVKHETGGAWAINATDVNAWSRHEYEIKVNANVIVPENYDPAGITAKGQVSAMTDLAWLQSVLTDLDYWPEGYAATGSASIELTTPTNDKNQRSGYARLQITNLKAQLPGDRYVEEPSLDVTAQGEATLDPKGHISTISAKWGLTAAAGKLQGQAVIDKADTDWLYTVEGSGEGDVGLLVKTVALATGAKSSPISGRWKIDNGKFTSTREDRAIQFAASATNLVTETPDEKKAIKLSDVAVGATVILRKDNTIDVPQSSFKVPGLVAEVVGSAHLPANEKERLIASGTVKSLKADLAELANFLRPLGYLPADAKLTGSAALADTRVATDAKGVVSAGGTLVASGLDIDLPASQLSIQEKSVKIPFSAAYDPETKHVTVSLDGLESGTASGTLHGSYAWAGADPVIDVQCDLVADGERLGGLAVKRYVSDMALSGPVQLKLATKGPVKSGGAWHQMIAGQTGSGSLTVDKMAYRGMEITKTTLSWRQADGQIQIGEAPDKPSQVALAGGVARLGGRLDLRGDVPHYIIDRPITMVEGADLTAPGIKEHLQFSIPILAEAKVNSGRVMLVVDSLDLPLDKTTLAASKGRGRVQIDNFQADMGKSAIGLLMITLGGQSQTPLQQYGPAELVLDKGVFSVAKHNLQLQPRVSLSLQGKVDLATENVNFVMGTPMTMSMLQKSGAPPQVANALAGEEIILPLTGQIGNLKYDEKALFKHVSEAILKAGTKGLIERFLPGTTGTSGSPGIPGLPKLKL
jgi:hypothetical protein